jgi:hypothetical protein
MESISKPFTMDIFAAEIRDDREHSAGAMDRLPAFCVVRRFASQAVAARQVREPCFRSSGFALGPAQ